MNFLSIRFKLLVGGTLLILLPLALSCILSYTKSRGALLALSKQSVRGTARDLAKLADQILYSDLYLASSLASNRTVVDIVTAGERDGGGQLGEGNPVPASGPEGTV